MIVIRRTQQLEKATRDNLIWMVGQPFIDINTSLPTEIALQPIKKNME